MWHGMNNTNVGNNYNSTNSNQHYNGSSINKSYRAGALHNSSGSAQLQPQLHQHISYQQPHTDFLTGDITYSSIASTFAANPAYQPQNFSSSTQPPSQIEEQSVLTHDYNPMADAYGVAGNSNSVNSAASAMANMNLVAQQQYSQVPNNTMASLAATSQQQYIASLQAGGMPTNQIQPSSGNQQQQHLHPTLMATSYGGVGMPQQQQQQQQQQQNSNNALSAAYYALQQHNMANSTMALQASYASATPQPTLMGALSGNGIGGVSGNNSGINGTNYNAINGGGSGYNNGSMGQSNSVSPTIFSIANPHNDYVWGARDAFPLRILVTREVVGQVIGKEGKNIRQVQQTSGTRIDVDRVTEIYTPNQETGDIINERKVIIHGNAAQCMEACKGLLVLLMPEEVQQEAQQQQVTLRMLAPNVLVGRIIGKRGVIIKQIMSDTNTRITVHENGIYDHLGNVADRIVSISGNLGDVCQCEFKVGEQLRAGFEEFGGIEGVYGIQPHNSNSMNQNNAVTALYNNAAALLGGGSSYGGGAYNNTGMANNTNNYAAAQLAQQALLFRGVPGGGVASSYYMPDPNTYFQNPLLGRPASSANNYYNQQHQYGNLSPLGGGSSTSAAGGMYNARTQAYQNALQRRSEGLDYTYVFVPVSSIGAIIGTSGANIKQCKITSGANLTVAPDAEDVGEFKDTSIAGKTVHEWRRVTIRGPPQAQYKAQYCLFQSVGSDAGLSPQQLEEIKLRIDIPVPRVAIGRIIGKSGVTVKDIQRIGHVRLAIPDLPSMLPDNTSSKRQQQPSSNSNKRDTGSSKAAVGSSSAALDAKNAQQDKSSESATKVGTKSSSKSLASTKQQKPMDAAADGNAAAAAAQLNVGSRASRGSQNASPQSVSSEDVVDGSDGKVRNQKLKDKTSPTKSDDIEDGSAMSDAINNGEGDRPVVTTLVKNDDKKINKAEEDLADAKPDRDAVVVDDAGGGGDADSKIGDQSDTTKDDAEVADNNAEHATNVDTTAAGDAGVSSKVPSSSAGASTKRKATKADGDVTNTTDQTSSPDAVLSTSPDGAADFSTAKQQQQSTTKTSGKSNNKQQQQQQSIGDGKAQPGSNATRTAGGGAQGSSFNNNANNNNSNANFNNRQQPSYGNRSNNTNSNFNNNNASYDHRRVFDKDHNTYYQHLANSNVALVQVIGSFGGCQYAQDQVRNHVQAVLLSQIQRDEQHQYYEKRYERSQRTERGGGQAGRYQRQQQQPNTAVSAATTNAAQRDKQAASPKSTQQQPNDAGVPLQPPEDAEQQQKEDQPLEVPPVLAASS